MIASNVPSGVNVPTWISYSTKSGSETPGQLLVVPLELRRVHDLREPVHAVGLRAAHRIGERIGAVEAEAVAVAGDDARHRRRPDAALAVDARRADDRPRRRRVATCTTTSFARGAHTVKVTPVARERRAAPQLPAERARAPPARAAPSPAAASCAHRRDRAEPLRSAGRHQSEPEEVASTHRQQVRDAGRSSGNAWPLHSSIGDQPSNSRRSSSTYCACRERLFTQRITSSFQRRRKASTRRFAGASGSKVPRPNAW